MAEGIWGLKLDQAKRLKELEKENTRRKRRVAELSLEKQAGVLHGFLSTLSFLRASAFARNAYGLARWMGEFSDGFLTVVAAAVMRRVIGYGAGSTMKEWSWIFWCHRSGTPKQPALQDSV